MLKTYGILMNNLLGKKMAAGGLDTVEELCYKTLLRYVTLSMESQNLLWQDKLDAMREEIDKKIREDIDAHKGP